jgi:hypothetical protein
MKKIKPYYLDSKIPCPLTRQIIAVRFIPEGLYDIYASKGYEFLFYEPKEVKIELKPDKNQDN